jgi:hypothetical protein
MCATGTTTLPSTACTEYVRCDQRCPRADAVLRAIARVLRNNWMVSDIREVVVTGKRARLRTQRLVGRGGNVFSFVAAPPQVG